MASSLSSLNVWLTCQSSAVFLIRLQLSSRSSSLPFAVMNVRLPCASCFTVSSLLFHVFPFLTTATLSGLAVTTRLFVGVSFTTCTMLGVKNSIFISWARQASPSSKTVSNTNVFFINSVCYGNHSSKSTSCNSCQGSPCLLSCSINGSGSNSSTLCTPGLLHLPVRNIIAPIMAGTPVV